ncbi:hypothetical protein KACHI17_13950 [Sediminibacterium sp. KACHI17]|uniref:Uncharacterized protein n=1 Tax=Sediminibacterium sp. KACHI17 TaxID=1751071 RepID=A0AAT9GIM9_9BACT
MQKTIMAEIPVQYYSKSIVLVDAGDVYTPGLALTKKREEVVTQIKRIYFSNLPDVLKKDLQMPVFTDTTLTEGEKALLLQNDNNVRAKIMERYKANIIILLQNYEGGFSQDEIQRSRNTDGSISKQATYSVFFNTNMTIIQGDQLYRKRITASKYHSQRQVLSGLLARGPGYEANKKDIAEMAQRNASNVSGLFRDRRGVVNGRGEFIETGR